MKDSKNTLVVKPIMGVIYNCTGHLIVMVFVMLVALHAKSRVAKLRFANFLNIFIS